MPNPYATYPSSNQNLYAVYPSSEVLQHVGMQWNPHSSPDQLSPAPHPSHLRTNDAPTRHPGLYQVSPHNFQPGGQGHLPPNPQNRSSGARASLFQPYRQPQINKSSSLNQPVLHHPSSHHPPDRNRPPPPGHQACRPAPQTGHSCPVPPPSNNLPPPPPTVQNRPPRPSPPTVQNQPPRPPPPTIHNRPVPPPPSTVQDRDRPGRPPPSNVHNRPVPPPPLTKASASQPAGDNNPAPSATSVNQASRPLPPPLQNKVAKRNKLPPPINQPERDALMEKPSSELRAIAARNAKCSMSSEDSAYFLKFHEHLDRLIAVEAIERGVSVPMVESLWGRRIAVRVKSRWNKFLQSAEIRARFKKGGGVSNSDIMGEVAATWQSLTEEEKDAYSPDNEIDVAAVSEEINPDDETAPELAHIATMPLARRSVSLQKSKQKMDEWMARWQDTANKVATLHSCQLLIIGVSTHLGVSSFQLVRGTPGAVDFIQYSNALDGTNAFAGRFQAYVTGQGIGAVRANSVNKAGSGSGKAFLLETIAQMSQLAAESTNGVLLQWPWANCDQRLAKAGYQLVLDNARIPEDCLKRSSRDLTMVQARMLTLDLKDHRIRVEPMEGAGDDTGNPHPSAEGSTRCRKKSFSTSSCKPSATKHKPRKKTRKDEAGIRQLVPPQVEEPNLPLRIIQLLVVHLVTANGFCWQLTNPDHRNGNAVFQANLTRLWVALMIRLARMMANES